MWLGGLWTGNNDAINEQSMMTWALLVLYQSDTSDTNWLLQVTSDQTLLGFIF